MKTLTAFDMQAHTAWKQMLLENKPAFFIDVGAFTGQFSLSASALGLPGIAIEPNPAAYKSLCANVRDKPVRTIRAAAGQHIGRSEFIVTQDQMLCTTVPDRIRRSGQSIKVRMITLDLLKNVLKPCALKVDVERAADFVLIGATQTLKKCNMIVIELIGKDELDNSMPILESAGFDMWQVNGKNWAGTK